MRLTATNWLVMVRDLKWEGSSLVGLHHFFLEVKPQPLDQVSIVRNSKVIYRGTWQDLADEQTLW